MSEDLTHQRFIVPRENRSLLAIPPLEDAPDRLRENQASLFSASCELHGRSLSDLRASTRRDAIALARSYTSALIGDDVPNVAPQSLVVSGHQPELFHIGVWAKNFSLAGIAARCHATAMNLIIDNDTMTSTSIRVPMGARDHLRFDRIPFDTPRAAQPWEEALLRDRTTFEQFGSQIHRTIKENWGYDPLIASSWDAAIAVSKESARLCDALTATRVKLERKWGVRNLELPMSRLCETDSFLWFVAHLMMRHRELFAIYNQTVADYRRYHRIRNPTQPVPDLERADGWFELPFWVWGRGDYQRAALFIRQTGQQFELRKGEDIIASGPYVENGSLEAVVDVLRELPKRGLRLRTRALTTTLFARLFLADLFLHGIGGAKYDEMTNRICHELFGIEAPDYLTVSATLYLPLGAAFSTTDADLRAVDHRIRDLVYNPDRHLDHQPEIQSLVQEKKKILSDAQSLRRSGELKGHLTRNQHRRLNEIRATLVQHVRPIQADYESRRTTLRAQLTANSLIRNREFAFVLYPEDLVYDFLVPLSHA